MSRRALVSVFLLGLAVRLIVLRELSDEPLSRVLLGDAEVFVAWGREVASGAWFGDEVFYQAPLYPYFLAVVFRLGGDVLAVKVVQALLGAATCVLVAAATGRLFDERAARVAGVVAALYAPAIWLEGMVQKTALATFLSACIVLELARALERDEEDEPPLLSRTLLAGVLLGLLTLVRENALVLVLPLLSWLVVRASRRKGAVVFLTGLAVVLVPVGLRNQALGGIFLPTSSNVGVNFYLGNHAGADGLYTPLVFGRGHARYEADDAQEIAEAQRGAELTPAEVSAFWFRRGLDDVLENPLRWARLTAWKTELLLHRTECMDAEAFEAHRAGSRLLDLLAQVFRFGLVLPFAVLGVGVALRDRDGLWPLFLASLALGASIAVFFVAARFRMGLVPFLLPFAGRGAVALVTGAREAARRQADLPLWVLAAFFAWLSNAPLTTWPISMFGELRGDPLATTESNLSSVFFELGEYDQAYAHASRALERDEDDVLAIFNLAHAARELGRSDEAIAAYEEAGRLEPTFAAECLMNIGLVHAGRDDLEAALASFDAATRADPTNARAHYNRGLALRRAGREEEAAGAYRASITLDPSFPDAHHNLGFLLEREGRTAEALEHYADALASDPRFALSLEHGARILALHPDPALRDGGRAAELAGRLLELEGETPRWTTLDLLAAALAEVGDLDGARISALRAARLCDDPQLRLELEERARAYGRGEARRP